PGAAASAVAGVRPDLPARARGALLAGRTSHPGATPRMDEQDLIYDWNDAGERWTPPPGPVQLDDETLRDGLQSPSLRTPTMAEKLRLLPLMDRLGIHTADIGLPGAGPHVVADVLRLAREIKDQRLKVQANCAARTLTQDITPVIEVSQQAGIPIE